MRGMSLFRFITNIQRSKEVNSELIFFCSTEIFIAAQSQNLSGSSIANPPLTVFQCLY